MGIIASTRDTTTGGSSTIIVEPGTCSTINWKCSGITAWVKTPRAMQYIVIRTGEATSFDDETYPTKRKARKAARGLAREHDDTFYVYKPIMSIRPKKRKVEEVAL